MRFGIRELIFFLLLLSMPLAAYFFVFKPRNQEIIEAKEEVNQKQDQLRKLKAVTGKIEDLQNEIEKLTEAIKLFEEKLPAEREVEVILKQVWEKAADQGLTPKKIRTEKAVPHAQYSELPLTMTITGDFDGFYSFLLELEKLNRITRMPEMKLEKATKAGEGQMEANIVLSIFYES